jgi:endonuclease-3
MPRTGKSRTASRTLRRVLELLRLAYGRRPWRRWGRAVDVLVATILSQNTSNANSSAGYRQLRRRFRSWQAAADAPVAQVEQCIRVSGLSRIKAPRIQRILRQIRDGSSDGRISLEHLRRLAPRQAYEELLAYDGVGPKTASCVLLFSLGMPLFPVDTHVERIAKRLGWIGAKATAEQVQEALTPLIAPEDRYEMHVLLIAHGRQTCKARGERCDWCSLAGLCPSAP